MREQEKWQKKYNMTKKEWDKPYFKDIIGGIRVPKEEKEMNYLEIEKATQKNYKGELTKLKKETLLKSYPNSINLLKEYYNSLIYAHEYISGNKYKNYYYFDMGSYKKTWEDILIEDRNTMLMVYAPYLNRIAPYEKEIYAKVFNINIKEIDNMIKKQKSILSSTKKNNLKIIKQIVTDILLNDYTKEELAKKYQIKIELIDKYIEQLKSIDIKTYNIIKKRLIENEEKSNQKMQKMISTLYDYITKGIEIDGKKSQFTLLDYYSLFNQKTQELIDFINKNKENKEIQTKRHRITRYIAELKNLGLTLSAEQLADKQIVFIINEKQTEIDMDISKKIIDFLNKNSIPTNYEIAYIAAKRYARGESIIPLISDKRIQEKKLTTQKEKTKKKTIASSQK